jgi:predicted Zn-dependent peptidase
MLNFKQLEGRHNVPVYFLKLPKASNSVSFHWVYFVGSADDEMIGKPGLYHWFEHVPFRGTKKYPGGYQAIDRPIARHGGSINASTSEIDTSFEISIPKHLWKKALDLVSDVAFCPLLRKEDIEAEREVIRKEIISSLSDVEDYAWEEASERLYPKHPLGHSVLGSNKTLNSMGAPELREAFKKGYDRSRLALFACGDLPEDELLREVNKALERAPNHGLSQRRSGAFYGDLPRWEGGVVTTRKTDFPSSIILFLFPFPAWNTEGKDTVWQHVMAMEMLCAGDLASPLYQVLREETNLIYEMSNESSPVMGGGYWGFTIETSPRDSGKVAEAFWDVVQNRKNRSRDRFEYVRDTIRGRAAMFPISPSDLIDQAQNNLSHFGEATGIHESAEKALAQPYKRVVEIMEGLNPNVARTIIMKGSA